MSGIRVTYSGLFTLVFSLLGIITGLVFLIIVTRSLSPEDYGTWGVINSLFVYSLVINSIVTFWSPREVARGNDTIKTALSFGWSLSVVGIIIYIISAYFVSLESDLDQTVMFFAVLLIPFTFLHKQISAINMGWKPEIISYALMATEIIKIPLALTFLYFLEMGIEGIIVTLIITTSIGSIIQLVQARKKITQFIKKEFVKKWIKTVWISLWPRSIHVLFVTDIVVFFAITKSAEGVAFFSAAFVIANLVTYAGGITVGSYGKLLGGGKRSFIKENLTHLFYFAIPLAAISITFSKPGLFALNPVYEIAFPVVIFLSIRMIFELMTRTFHQYLTGIEDVDAKLTSSTKEYLKSKLFVLPNLQIIQNVIYIGILAIVLFLQVDKLEKIDLVIHWAIIALITQIPLALYLGYLVKKNFTIKIEWIRLGKYLVVSIGIFSLCYVLHEEYLVYNTEVIKFVPNLLLFIAIGVIGYLGITYAIDAKIKELFNLIYSEIKNKS